MNTFRMYLLPIFLFNCLASFLLLRQLKTTQIRSFGIDPIAAWLALAALELLLAVGILVRNKKNPFGEALLLNFALYFLIGFAVCS